jgi:protein involved in polysaccharide export with SLBB domain
MMSAYGHNDLVPHVYQYRLYQVGERAARRSGFAGSSQNPARHQHGQRKNERRYDGHGQHVFRELCLALQTADFEQDSRRIAGDRLTVFIVRPGRELARLRVEAEKHLVPDVMSRIAAAA